MKHGLSLIILCIITSLGMALISADRVKVKVKVTEKVIYIDKVKVVSYDADTVLVPSGKPILSSAINRKLSESSGFGYRTHPVLNELKLHTGIDISCAIGSEVLATAAGKVIRIQYSPTGYGNNIIIKHGNSYKTLYAHLDKINVTVNQTISKGEVIGYSGNTGQSTGPHLHYEVIKKDKKVDPNSYL